MKFARWARLLAGCAVLTLAGCSIGPGVIRMNLLRYNRAVSDTENEQFLLNIVRLRYRDPPKTLTIGSVTSSFDVDATAPVDFAVGQTRGSALTRLYNILLPQAHFADAPTVAITPLSGGDYHGGLATPMELSHLVALANSGWDLDRLLRVLVFNLNGVRNVAYPAGQGGERVPEFEEFVRIAQTLGRLQ